MSIFRSMVQAGLALLIILVVSATAGAQEPGTIQGMVSDTVYGGGLPGANVYIKETLQAVTTGHEGQFKISNLSAGIYTLVISLLGYKTVEETVHVKEGEVISIEIALEPGPVDLTEVEVEAERPLSAASSRAIRQLDLRIRPNRSAQDMLQLAPGLIIAQHAGGGKAEQIFMRGFDADHGTDVAVYTDGIPVNMVTHAHGQGYADLHFLIPEVVESIDVYKGPYFARFGNLGTAGSVVYSTMDHIPRNQVLLEGGSFDTAKITTIFRIPTGDSHQSAYFAGQFYRSDGPFESPQDFQRFNVFGKFHTHITENSKLAFTLGAFSSGWDASGQIPERSVKDRTISRFGAIDGLEGGTTSRQNFSLNYTAGEGTENEFQIQGYACHYNFKLFSNFTFFLNDSVEGDMIEQTEARYLTGINSMYKLRSRFGNVISNSVVGASVRADNIAVALWKSPDRVRRYARKNNDVFERNFSLWAEEELIFSQNWRIQLGLRGDYFTFNVDDHLYIQENLESEPSFASGYHHQDVSLPSPSGYHHQGILSPKLNLVYRPLKSTDVYMNVGSGFHSNDARNVVYAQRIGELERALRRRGLSDEGIRDTLLRNGFDPDHRVIKTLPRAIGAEVGLRTYLTPRFVIGLAVWWLYMEEELVYVGDEGITEISGETRRLGLDLETRLQINPWIWADLDLNIADGRYINEPEGANHIPLAPRITSTGGLSIIHPSGFEGMLRYRFIADRPANEFNTVTAYGHTQVGLMLGYRVGAMRFFGTMENILDSEWNDAQFDTESRLFYETHSVSELHFTPGNPRNIRLGFSYSF